MVDIQVSGVHHFKISDRLREHVREKLGSLERFHLNMTKIIVTLGEAENKSYRADVEMHLAHEKDVIAHVVAETVYAAIDKAADKAAAQMRRMHSKHAKQHSDRQAAAPAL